MNSVVPPLLALSGADSDPAPAIPRPGHRAAPVDAESVALIRLPELEDSPEFQQMTARLQASERIVETLGRNGPIARDQLLTRALDDLVREGHVDGLIVGSADGFVVAHSSGLAQAELLAVIGSAFEFAARRLQAEHLVEAVDELSARGRNGEQVVMRYFPGPDREFFLLSYSRQPATYRRTMARALRRCAEILSDPSPAPAPAALRPRHSHRLPSPPLILPILPDSAGPGTPADASVPIEPLPIHVAEPARETGAIGPVEPSPTSSADLPAAADEVSNHPNQSSQ